ncbi:hypothetical protein QAD02_001042 [Eretmocerus hayati]|uniref:Uncharacterized protein n=1 Tax=Eretmocerus hayati TaxID=131215 RepID=A0ACC2NG74_9HYME|nr:hypothetical protein QAD02_001042 [Eretmocerus hayati]
MRPTVDINQLKDNIVIELKKFSADKEGIETLKQQKDTTRVFKGQYDEIASLDAPLTSYKSIYASPVRNLCDDETNNVYRDSAFALIGLAKYTSIFGRTYDFDEIEKLMENDTAIFVGAFLARISWIISSKCSTFKLYDPGEHVLIAQQRNRLLKGEAAWIRKINISLDPISMLTPQGCIPNIGCCRTYGTQNLAYALQPIKAGTPLIISTTGPSVYDYSKTIDRQPTSWLYYDKECDCQACTEDWYKMLRKPTENQGELWEEMCSILGEWEAHSGTPNYPNEKVLSRVKKLVARTWIEYPMPSAILINTTYCFILEIESLDAPLTSYKSIFASPTRNLDEDESASCSYNSVLALIALAKYTSVFGTSYDFDDLGKLAKNKSAIFVGAFILKISLIIASKCISDPGMSATLSAQLDEALKDEAAWVRKRNMSLNPISMLSLVGCIPNFGTSLTHGGKVAVWAIQPIKPGDQLIAYLPPTVYDFSNKIVRQPRSWLYFDKECDCQACKENWSEIIRKPITSRGKLWKEMWSILLSWQRNSGALDYPNIEYVTRCKNLASEIWKEYPMPSAMYVAMMRIMHRVFMIFFTPSEIVASRKGLHQIECFLPEEEQLPDTNVNSSS